MLPKYLYNVTCYAGDRRGVLEPSIPKSAAVSLGEDKTTKRVCLADSVAHCLSAMCPDKRNLFEGAEIFIRRVDTARLDKSKLLTPEYLFATKYVPDSLENNEYWYLDSIQFDCYIGTVQSFKTDFGIAWSCIRLCDVLRILRSYANVPPILIQTDSPEELFKYVTDYYMKNEYYDECDNLCEDVSLLPWAQKLDIRDLKYKEVAYVT